MNSLRARGVMSFQAASAFPLAISAFRRSAGSLRTTPAGIRSLLTRARYAGAGSITTFPAETAAWAGTYAYKPPAGLTSA